MAITVGEHPIPMTVILVQGSTADLVVPSEVTLTAPKLEFALNRGAEPTITHDLAQEAGEWVVHLSAAQVEALASMAVARVKAQGRVLAAGTISHNTGWHGAPVSRAAMSQIIWGGGGGGGGGVTDHGALTGLADDDHPHYLTQARGDARYYTEAEVDALLAGVSGGDTGPLALFTALPSSPTAWLPYEYRATSATTFPGTIQWASGAPTLDDWGMVVLVWEGTTWRGEWVSMTPTAAAPGEVTPMEPTFTDQSGTANDTYTIPAQAGVEYLKGGSPITAGTYTPTAGEAVTITAQPASGYSFPAGATTSWSHTFDTTTSNTAPSMTLGAPTITGLQVSQPFTTSDVDGDTVTVTAAWGDGASGTVTSPAVHTYAAAGTYNATFTPNDGITNGAVRNAQFVLTAGPPPVGNPATLAAAMTLYGAAGYWKLDETTGTTAVDSSGNGRDGSLVGTVGTDLVLGGENGYLKWVSPGGGAAPSAWVDVPSEAAFSVPNPGAITVFACAKIVTSHTNRMMVRKGVDVGSREWQFGAPAANTTGKVTTTSGTFIAESNITDNANTPGTWRAHATVLPRPGGADVPIVYRDSGTPQPVTTNVQAGTNTAGAGVLRIGASWVGGIGHVAVFPHALTDAHIQKLVDLARAEAIIP